MDRSPALAAALARLRTAEAAYLDLMAGVRDCPSYWPSDPPGANYLGTRCQKALGPQGQAHEGQHRHRVIGTQTVVEW